MRPKKTAGKDSRFKRKLGCDPKINPRVWWKFSPKRPFPKKNGEGWSQPGPSGESKRHQRLRLAPILGMQPQEFCRDGVPAILLSLRGSAGTFLDSGNRGGREESDTHWRSPSENKAGMQSCGMPHPGIPAVGRNGGKRGER